MKKLIFLITLSLLMVSMAWGATTFTATYTFSGTTGHVESFTYNGTTYPGMTMNTIDKVGITSSSSTSNFRATEWSTGAIDTGKYIGFTMAAANGYKFSVSTISFGLGRSNTGTRDSQWRGSADSYAALINNYTTLNNGLTNTSGVLNNPDSNSNWAGNVLTLGSSYADVTTNCGFRFYMYNAEATTGTAGLTGVLTISGTYEVDGGSPTPTISLAPTALTDFTYVYDNGPSSAQSFAVTGSNLTGNLTVSSSATDYVVSSSSGGTYGTSLSLTQSSGAVSATVYVKLASGLAIGNYNSQNITVSGGGATAQTVTCSGSVTTPPAPSAPTATTATSIDNNSFTANWGAVSGATGYYLDVYTKTAGTNATDLFISEYIEGSSNNKAIEIYNGTGAEVDLNDYLVYTYSNGAETPYYTHAPTVTLADGDVYIVANSGSDTAIKNVADAYDTVTNFNGNDAVALYKISTTSYVDIIGCIGSDPGSAWTSGTHSTAEQTLVRKSTVTNGITTNPDTGFPTLESEWESYAQDTFSYLGSHTMAGGSSLSYVTGFENLDVSNVTTYAVTGLDPETTYYYVVRAYDAYAQTSANSNEIEAITTAAVTYDYPEDVEIDAGEVLITVAGGSGNIDALATPTPIPNPNFTVVFEQVITLFGDGPWLVSVISLDEWVACYFDGVWTAQEPDTGTGCADFWIELGGKNATIELKSGNGGNPTLPVELSNFTIALNGYNNAVLTWVTQTETNVSGFYIYRNTEANLAAALMVSNLIPATNTSQQQVYQFTDKSLEGVGTYYYWLQVSDLDGSESFYGPVNLVYEQGETNPNTPLLTELKGIYPNPFNPSTTIRYSLAKAAEVKVNIYNRRGQLVRKFSEGQKHAGDYKLIWNGRDDKGNNQASGVYFFRVQIGEKTFSSKAVLLK